MGNCYEDFKEALDKTIMSSDIVKIKAKMSGLSFEFYQYVSEIYEEDNNLVVSFEDDSTMIFDYGAVSFREQETYGKVCYVIEGSDMYVEVTVM